MIATLPLPPKLDLIMLEAAIHEYQATLDKKVERLLVTEDDTQQLNHLLLQIDALVLKGYDLPPRLERQLFDYFDSRKRPVLHEFEGWLPKELNGYVPLHEWLTRDQEANRGPWVSKVFKPAPASENEVLERFLH